MNHQLLECGKKQPATVYLPSSQNSSAQTKTAGLDVGVHAAPDRLQVLILGTVARFPAFNDSLKLTAERLPVLLHRAVNVKQAAAVRGIWSLIIRCPVSELCGSLSLSHLVCTEEHNCFIMFGSFLLTQITRGMFVLIGH